MAETLSETRPPVSPEDPSIPGAQPPAGEQGGFDTPVDPVAMGPDAQPQIPGAAAGQSPEGSGPEAPNAQTRQETAAERHDARVRYADTELLGRSYSVRRTVTATGHQTIKTWQGLRAKVRNAVDTPGKAIRKFALNRAKSGYDRKEKRLQAATSERLKGHRQSKLDKATDKLIKREVSHDTRAKRMESRTNAVHENAERRHQNYIDKLKAKKGDVLAKKALHKQLREEGAGWLERRKITSKTMAEMSEQSPEQLERLGKTAMEHATSRRYEDNARRGYDRADRSRQRTEGRIDRTDERIENSNVAEQQANEAAKTARELLPGAQQHAAELQDQVEVEMPGTARYNVLAGSLKYAQEQVTRLEATIQREDKRAEDSRARRNGARGRRGRLDEKLAGQDQSAAAAHSEVRARRTASRQYKTALDQEATAALNPDKEHKEEPTWHY